MPDENATEIDQSAWPGADQFRFFRTYERPHYAVTARVDVSRLMARKSELPVFRTCLWAIGAGLHAAPQLRLRFQGDVVRSYERLELSPTIATEGGDFRYTYLTWQADRAAFDAHAAEEIAKVRAGVPLNANTGQRAAVAYLSCLPWLDYTSVDNALPHADDCIPQVSWGKIVPSVAGHDMAMTIQVHHALVHGYHVSQFLAATQGAFDALA
ncbi:Chloramphenicol acetyltransferase [Candidatus Rhodobacter oscarellae]|uniref:Chloramphenicol acetyltransferase n=1 Tax=Candidatus Rhodobacter oscarellae TaxID=1675527 RepID=A0A0J9GT15_9RHOB|nr:CatA-like O-acetyltransferase [Candidatus Rhodobacter lobularis]KMW56618.1 Chloramphenicol acetyltransferase [Candidatus Rhodobacter lobularis]